MKFPANTLLLPKCSDSALQFVIAGIALTYLLIAAIYLSYILTGQDPFSVLVVAVLVLFAGALWRMTRWARSVSVVFLWMFLFFVALEGILRNVLAIYYKYSGLEKLDPNQTMAQFLFNRLLLLGIALAIFVTGYKCIRVLAKHRDEFQQRLI